MGVVGQLRDLWITVGCGELDLFEVEGRNQRARERPLLRGEKKADVHA